jgi:hypothetical protein
MRLISKQHDYYDSIFRHYSKDSKVFVRNSSEITVIAKGMPSISLPEVNYNHFQYRFTFGIVGFCGNLYPYIRVIEIDKDNIFYPTSIENYAYSLADFGKAVKGYSDHKLKYFNRIKTLYTDFYKIVEDWLENSKIDRWRESFELDNCKDLTDIFTEHKVAYFNICLDNFRYKDNVELYPVLADYQFFRVMDIFVTYQTLEYYLCNILVAPDNPYIEPVGDKIKAESKGFDKFSFRKEKQS